MSDETVEHLNQYWYERGREDTARRCAEIASDVADMYYEDDELRQKAEGAEAVLRRIRKEFGLTMPGSDGRCG